MNLIDQSAVGLRPLAAATDEAIARLEDAFAAYVGAANRAAVAWRQTAGQAGPIQGFTRDAPDNLAKAAVHAQAAINRAVGRAMQRAREA